MDNQDHQRDKDEIMSALVRLEVEHEALSKAHESTLVQLRQAERLISSLTTEKNSLIYQVDKLLANLGVDRDTIASYHEHFVRLSNFIKELPANVQQEAEIVLEPVKEFLKVSEIKARKRDLRLQSTKDQ